MNNTFILCGEMAVVITANEQAGLRCPQTDGPMKKS